MASLILAAPATNDVVDCYTKAPVDKMTLLATMKERFGLLYEVREVPAGVNATGVKMNYFSRNMGAGRYGYLPARTSLDTVIFETSKLLDV